MNGVAEFVEAIKVDGDRYDVWRSRNDGSLYISEFCQDNLKEVGEEQLDVVLSKIN